jgi:hypothetical protein
VRGGRLNPLVLLDGLPSSVVKRAVLLGGHCARLHPVTLPSCTVRKAGPMAVRSAPLSGRATQRPGVPSPAILDRRQTETVSSDVGHARDAEVPRRLRVVLNPEAEESVGRLPESRLERPLGRCGSGRTSGASCALIQMLSRMDLSMRASASVQ